MCAHMGGPRRNQKRVRGGPAQAQDEDLVETFFGEIFRRPTAEEEGEDEGTKEHGEVGENGRAQGELACGEGQLYIT